MDTYKIHTLILYITDVWVLDFLKFPKHFHFSALTNVLLMWIIHVQHKCEKLNTFGTLAMLFFLLSHP